MLPILLSLTQASLVPEPSRQTDFCPEVSRLVNLQEGLSATLGVPVEFTAKTKDEVIAIHAKAVSRQALMDQIAFALDATWTKVAGRLRLDRTSEDERAMLARERVFAAEAIAQWKMDSQLNLKRTPIFGAAQAKAWTEQYKQIVQATEVVNYSAREKLEARTPAARFITRLIQEIPTADLASVEPGSRVVFRQRPTRLQKLLIVPKEAVQIFQTEQRFLNDAVKQAGIQEEFPEEYLLGKGAPTEVIVIAQPSESQITLNAHLADQSGTYIERASAQIPTWQTPQPSGKPDGPIHYATLATEFREMWRKLRTGEPAIPSAELQAYARSLEKHDPLGIGLTEAVAALSEAENKPVVVRAWDSLWLTSLAISRLVGSGVEGFRGQLSRERADVQTNNGWIVIRSARPASFVRSQANRVALSEWIQQCTQTKLATLTDTAIFSHRSPGEIYSLPVFWIGLAVADARTDLLNRIFGQWMRAYGALTPTQRSALQAGKTLTWQQLGPDVQRHLERQIFDGSIFVNNLSTAQSIQADPTTLFVNGIPTNAELSMKETRRPILLGLQKIPNPFGRGVAERGAASIGYQLARGGEDPMSRQRADHVRFRVGENVDVALSLQLAPGIEAGQNLEGYECSNPTIYSIRELPEPFKSKVDKAVEYYRNHPAATMPGSTQDELPED